MMQTTLNTESYPQDAPVVVGNSFERMTIAAMERAFQSGRTCFAVQSRRNPSVITVQLADKFAPTPDMQILFVAWPPGWRYGQPTHQAVVEQAAGTLAMVIAVCRDCGGQGGRCATCNGVGSVRQRCEIVRILD